jgi:hypothetical protein
VCGTWKAWEKLERNEVFVGRPERKGILEDLGMHVLKGVLNREGGCGLYSCWLRVRSGVVFLRTGF